MSLRTRTVLWIGIPACVVALWVAWTLYSKPSLERSTVVLVPGAGVVAPAGKGDVLTILYSGDGGWADLDRQLGEAFVSQGIPVLGVSAFKYFWRNRPPDKAAAALDALMSKYLQAWDKRRVWLVGFSFGADVLPMLVDRLSPANRKRVTQVVLLAPERSVGFEIQFEGYMMAAGRFKAFVKTLLEKFNKVEHYDAIPPLRAINDGIPVVCYYGRREAAYSLCTDPRLPAWVTVHEKEGDHHFAGGYAPLAAQMISELPAR